MYTTRSGSITTWTYNKNGEINTVRFPDGNLHEYVWDDTNANYLSQGNLLCFIRDPGPQTLAPDGTPQLPLITNYTYEPVFNHVVTMQDARGNYPGFVPPNGGNATWPRYVTHYKYEYQVPGGIHHPNLVNIDYPTVNPVGAPHEDFGAQYSNQIRTESWTYYANGQGFTHTNLQGSVENWTYFPHEGWLFNITDNEGYVSQHIQDITGFHVETNYTRDWDGNPTTITDGKGKTVDMTFAPRCLLLNVTSPPPSSLHTNIQRDANGNPTQLARQETAGGAYTTLNSTYDIIGNVLTEVKNTARPANSPWTGQATILTTAYCYDLNDNRIMERRPESMNLHQVWDLTTTVYDERNNAMSVTRGGIPDQYYAQPRSPAGEGCGIAMAQVLAAGVGLRNRGVGDIIVPGVVGPALGGTVYWEVMQDYPADASSRINFNGHTVQGTMVGFAGDLCWGARRTFAYKADVTQFVSGPGPYNVQTPSGSVTGTDPWPPGWSPGSAEYGTYAHPAAYQATPPILEGASLVVLAKASVPHEIVSAEEYHTIYGGGGGTTASSATSASSTSPPPYTNPLLMVEDQTTIKMTRAFDAPGNSTLILIGGDGQPMPKDTEAYWNNALLPNAFDGTDPQAPPTYSWGSLWDTDHYNVAAPLGANHLWYYAGSNHDCIGPEAAYLDTPLFLDDAEPSTISKTYDGNRHLIWQKDGMGNVTTYQYDGYDRQTATVDPLHGRSETKYDPVDDVVQTDFCGYSTPNGILSATDDVPAWNYAPAIVSCLTTPLPHGTQLYSLAQTSQDEAKRAYRTDQLYIDLVTGIPLLDGPLTVTHVNNDRVPDGFASSLTEYDAASHTVRTVNDNRHASVTSYNSLGLVSSTIDAVGNTVTNNYDKLGRLSNGTHTDINPESWLAPQIWNTSATSDELGRQDSSTDSAGQTSTSGYDGLGDKTQQTSPMGSQVNHTYDGLSRHLQDRYDASWFAQEDVNHHVTYTTDDGSYTSVDHGSWVEFTFGNGTVVRFTAAPTITTATNGTITIVGTRIVNEHVRHPQYINVTYDYDGDGRLVEMRDGLNQTTRYKYDALGRKTREIAPDGTDQRFRYDRNDQVVWFKDPNGNVVTTTYDALNRPTRIHAERGTGVIGTTDQHFIYDAQGRKVKEWDQDNSASIGTAQSILGKTYDSLGHVISETENGQTGTSVYDGVGNRLTYTYPNQRMINTTYDPLERPKEVWSLGIPQAAALQRHWSPDDTLYEHGANRHHMPGDELLANYTYIGPSHLNSRTFYDNLDENHHTAIINETRTYDAAHHLVSLAYLDMGGAPGFTYGYDQDSRLISKGKASGDEAYNLDNVDRLTNYTRTGSTMDLAQESWRLDAANNWASIDQTTGSGTATSTRSNANTNEMTSQTTGATSTSYSYDANGNLLDDGVHMYKWDFKNRLREVHLKVTATDPAKFVGQYSYDAENRRVKSVNPYQATATVYFLDGMNEVQEQDCLGVITHQYVYGRHIDELIAQDVPKAGATGLSTICLQQNGAPQNPVAAIEQCGSLIVTGTCGPCNATTTSGVSATCTPCIQSASYPLNVSVQQPPPTPDCASCSVSGSTSPAVDAAHASVSCMPCAPSLAATMGAGAAPYGNVSASQDCVPCTPYGHASAWVNATTSGVTNGTQTPKQDSCVTVYVGKRLFFLQDEQQSVYGVGAANGLVQAFDYDPYGRVSVISPTLVYGCICNMSVPAASAPVVSYLYTGRRYDPDSGLYYYRSRFMDSKIGTFISRDMGGPWGDPNNLGSATAYVGNEAVSKTDAHGRNGHGGEEDGANDNPGKTWVGFIEGFGGDSGWKGGCDMHDPDNYWGQTWKQFAGSKSVVRHIYACNETGDVTADAERHAQDGSPIILVGHSWGAQTLLYAAARMYDDGYCVDVAITVDRVKQHPWADSNWISPNANEHYDILEYNSGSLNGDYTYGARDSTAYYYDLSNVKNGDGSYVKHWNIQANSVTANLVYNSVMGATSQQGPDCKAPPDGQW